MRTLTSLLLAALCFGFSPVSHARLQSGEVHVWEVQEISLATSRDYPNPYVDVECWVELEGPDFRRRVYGFWDGGRASKIRVVATLGGLDLRVVRSAGRHRPCGAGKFTAVAWTPRQIADNPTVGASCAPSANGHALR